MTTFQSPTGTELELADDTVCDLKSLAYITRQPTDIVAAKAVEMLRNTLVPSTKEPVARATRRAKGATA